MELSFALSFIAATNYSWWAIAWELITFSPGLPVASEFLVKPDEP